ncbi:hypothetical protein ACWKWP_04895 [Agromyces soli]
MQSPDDRTARLVELQRLAYGAGGTDEERAAAAAELAALRAEGGAAQADAPGTASAADVVDAAQDASSTRPVDEEAVVQASAAAERRAHRHLFTVGAIAAASGLLIGGLGGWQLAVQAQEAAAEAAPRPGTVAALTPDDELAALQWQPVEQTPASRALEREPSADDAPGLWGTGEDSWARGFIDIDTVRRLAVIEQLLVYGARSTEHDELCLVLVFKELGDVRCTEHGVFPTQGLELATRFGDATGAVSPEVEVRWMPDGSTRVMTPWYPPGVAPASGGRLPAQ